MTLIEHVNAARALGWHVFPVNGKQPTVKWRDAVDTDANVAYWFSGKTASPATGYGVDCGRSRLVVLDEDLTGALDAFAGERPLPPTLVVSTGKGRHLYYRAPEGHHVGNSASRLAEGVDVRAAGGYVVGPGSAHPSGATYAVAENREVAPLPEWLLPLLVKPERTLPPATGAPPPTADAHPYAKVAVSRELDRLANLPRPWHEGANWDTVCFEVACNLIEIANSPWSGYSLVIAERDFFGNAPSDSIWGSHEHRLKWDSALNTVGAHARAEPERRLALVEPHEMPTPESPTFLSADGPAEVGDEAFVDEAPDAAHIVESMFPNLDWNELFATDDDGEEWILEPLLAARRLVALFSAPKAGKSLLMLELALCLAQGTAAFGNRLERPVKVLYIDFENDPRGDVKRRLEAMGYGQDEARAGRLDNLKYQSFPNLAKLDTQQGGQELLLIAQHYGCEVVVIDTISRAVGGEENVNDTWLAFYRNTGLLLKRAGIACLRLDHSGKDAEKGMRGGSAKYGDVDAVWKLTAESESVLVLQCTDHRMPVEQDRIVLVREQWPNLHHRLAEGGMRTALDAREQEIDDLLDRLMVPRTASVREVKKAVRDAGERVNNAALERVVRARKNSIPEVSPGHSGDTSGHPEGVSPGQHLPKGGVPGRSGGVPERCPEGFAGNQHPGLCGCGRRAEQ